MPSSFHNHQRKDAVMRANYQAILSECIERGIMNYMRSLDIVNPAMLQALESEIWLQLDSLLIFEET